MVLCKKKYFFIIKNKEIKHFPITGKRYPIAQHIAE